MSKNSEPADAEGTSSSIKDEIIRGLNEDLAREYKAIIQYVVFSNTLKGAEYGDIAEQLKKHASQELAHALEASTFLLCNDSFSSSECIYILAIFEPM